MMRGQQYREPACLGEAAYSIENPQLVTEIEARSRLVEHQDSGFLCQRARDERELAFSAADSQPFALGKMLDPKCRDGLVRHLAIGGRGSRKGSTMGSAPHQYQFGNRKRKCAAAALRHISECQCAPAWAPTRGRFAIDTHCAGMPREQAEDRLEQCRFTFAIAAEHTQHLAGTDTEADMAADDPSRITVTQILDGQPRGAYDHAGRRLKARSHKKTGVPKAAVKTPSGNSTVPIVRATVSTASR